MTDLAPIAVHMMAVERLRSAGASHQGAVRRRNEDRFVNRPDLGLWAVADGAGGHQSGDVAAATVADALSAVPSGLGAAELLAEVRLRVARAHARLRAEAARRGGDAVLATTVVVLLSRGDHYACLWAGDSRAYLLRGGRLVQVTRDHSAVQELLDAGVISPAEARDHPRANVITRAVGAAEEVVLDKITDRLRAGDRFLLCSDGLSKTLAEDEIASLLAGGAAAARPLIAAALAREADDNVTAVTIEVGYEAADLEDTAERAGISAAAGTTARRAD
jgi:serine/threonine-protein phosphatase Stp1